MSAHRHHRPSLRGGAFITALLITLAYAAVEFAGGLWTGSLALLSDSGHMLSDALALGLAAIAAWLARRPVGHRHSYGWARAEVIGAWLNSLLMLVIIVALVVEAVARLLHPRPVAALGMMVIALVGMAVNALVIWIMSRGEMTLNARAALLHVIGDLVSSFAALVAGTVIYFTGWLPIDPILSLVIAGLILISTIRLLRDTLHVLMEGVPPALELQLIGKALAGVSGVVSVHDLHVWSITPGQVALSAHLEIRDLQRWPTILAAATALAHDRFGIGHVTLQPEAHGPRGGRGTAVIRLWRGKSGPRSGLS
jgi:cobalt-zinc-cadmium efflux system protein